MLFSDEKWAGFYEYRVDTDSMNETCFFWYSYCIKVLISQTNSQKFTKN